MKGLFCRLNGALSKQGFFLYLTHLEITYYSIDTTIYTYKQTNDNHEGAAFLHDDAKYVPNESCSCLFSHTK